MNVLQILPELNIGGVERGTVDLAKYLIKRGHKAVVISNGGDLVQDLRSFGATHYHLPVHEKSLISMVRMVSRIEEIILKEDIHIVHARSRIPAWSAYFAARKSRRVFITTCHGYYKKHLFSHVMGWGKRVIVPSNIIARHMIEDFDVPRDRIKLIPRSVDMERFTFADPGRKQRKIFNVGIIGRLTPIKGHLYFIKAMAKAARVIRDLKIWVVGDAPAHKEAYKEQIKILTKRLGLWKNTEFLGAQKDIPGVMSHLDLLILATTTQEAFGRVIVEAQAAGVPVIATSVGGVVDIIEHGKTGLLVPPADPRAMADAVVEIFSNREHTCGMIRAAHKKVLREYTVDLMVERTLGVYQEALEAKRILVIKFSSLGDVILSTAAIRALRKQYPAPKFRITVLTGIESKDILLRNPHIDELLVCDFKNKDRGLSGFLKLSKSLRKKNFDIVIDLQNNRRSHLLSWLTLAFDRYGYANKKFGGLLNHTVAADRAVMDPVSHQFRIFRMLNVANDDPHLEMFPTAEDDRFVEDFLKSQWLAENQKLVGIHITASPRWQTKVWPAGNIVRLCEELGKRDIRVVITGTDKDRALVTSLAAGVKNLKLINSCGKLTINQLACLIKRCAVYITGDSAPLHIAAGVDTPVIALFGPTDPKRHMPPARVCSVIRKKLPCSPCYKPKCAHGKCMSSITAEEVMAEVDKLLK